MAASLFFSPRLRLRARRCLLRCSITGVTRRWTFGAANFCFLPSFTGSGRLMTYWQTSSSLVRLNNFLILLLAVLHGERPLDDVLADVIILGQVKQLPDLAGALGSQPAGDGVVGQSRDLGLALLHDGEI